MKLRSTPIRVGRRWLQRNFYWALICAVLGTLVLVQARGPKRVVMGPPHVVFDLPEYAQRRVTIPAGVKTVGEYIGILRDQGKVRIDVLWPRSARNEEAITANSKISIEGAECEFAEAVRRLRDATGDQLRPEYESGRLVLADIDEIEAPAQRPTISYGIADLLTSEDARLSSATRGGRVDDIIALIRSLIRPEVWRENGGVSGEMKEIDGKLIVTAPRAVQEQVRQLLEELGRR